MEFQFGVVAEFWRSAQLMVHSSEDVLTAAELSVENQLECHSAFIEQG